MPRILFPTTDDCWTTVTFLLSDADDLSNCCGCDDDDDGCEL